MKPLTKEEQDETVRLLKLIVQKVERYSVSHAVNYKTTVQHRLHDSVALADAVVQARDWFGDLDYANTVAAIKYEVDVLEALTEGPDATRKGVSPVLSDTERWEMREWFERGDKASDFAQMIYERDAVVISRRAANT